MLTVFSLGLGIPFIGVALLLNEAGEFIKKYATFVNDLSLVGGIILIALGVLMLLGDMGLLVTWGFSLFSGPYNTLLQYM